MIDMAMREQEQFQIDTARMRPIASAFRGIEEDRAFRGGDEIAVCFENAATKRFVGHVLLILNEPTASGEQRSRFNRCQFQVATT